MAYRISLLERNAALVGAVGLFDKGANPSVSSINIYSTATSQPATPETAPAGGSIVLVNIPFSSAAFGTPSAGSSTANNLPISGTVATTGTAGWFSFINGASTPAVLSNGTITINGGGGDMTFDNISFVQSGVAVINSLSISQPM